jgi:two-component sensor histidine kinase
MAEALDRGWLDAVHPDDRAATIDAWDHAREHGMLDAEFRVRRAADGAWLWHHSRSVPVRDASGGIVEWLGTTTDVHQLKALQERQGVLTAELQHRTRNLMGIVRSMSERTMDGAADLETFAAAYRVRLAALARVQGLLSRRTDGHRVTFDELVIAELLAMGAVDPTGAGRQVTLDGVPGATLRSGIVQTLALALHELATNAGKYGALAQLQAHLLVRWRIVPDAGASRLRVEWIESGVDMPRSGAAVRHGYGRELIERALPYQLNAATSYVLGSDGVRCTIELALAPQA